MEEGEQKVASRANLARQRLAAGEPARSPSPRSPRRIPHRAPPSTAPAAPTWRRPGPERVAGSSPVSPRLPLPCPGKGFGERRTGRSCARGRRPSSGRRTSPGRGCPSRAVCWELARRRPASGAQPRGNRLDAGRRRGSVHPQLERRARRAPGLAALARRRGSSSRPRWTPRGGARGHGSAPARPGLAAVPPGWPGRR